MGFLGGIGDFLFGKDYSDQQKGNIQKVVGPLKTQLGTLHGGSQAALYKSLGAINKGYGTAQKALAMQGALGTKQVLDREKQMLASTKQAGISSGFFGSSMNAQAEQGVGYATNQALAELNTGLAQAGSNLEIQQGQDIANVYANLSGLNQNYSSVLAQLGLGQLGAAQGIQYGKQGGNINEILKIGAAAAGGGGF